MASDELELGHSAALGRIRQRTPARLFVGRCGAAYRTATQLQLRAAQAAAADAVRTELELERDLGAGFLERYRIFEVQSAANNKSEYLRNP
ncbi:MAG TPA: ethanolamine ammonia-lyase light chain EutC, partial [Terriglobales bacterium]|nr:ethanolamine ammonia-lyase light chain EutC [Terriglobales bacterium]